MADRSGDPPVVSRSTTTKVTCWSGVARSTRAGCCCCTLDEGTRTPVWESRTNVRSQTPVRPRKGASRAATTSAIATSRRADEPTWHRAISRREMLVEMIWEYARHLGHADLLRERIDGRIGQ